MRWGAGGPVIRLPAALWACQNLVSPRSLQQLFLSLLTPTFFFLVSFLLWKLIPTPAVAQDCPDTGLALQDVWGQQLSRPCKNGISRLSCAGHRVSGITLGLFTRMITVPTLTMTMICLLPNLSGTPPLA